MRENQPADIINISFSYRSLEQMKPFVTPSIIHYFQYSWSQILDSPDLGFAVYPFSQDLLDELQHTYFWRKIIQDIIKYSLKDPVLTPTQEYLTEFVNNLQKKDFLLHIPLFIGEALLYIHKKIKSWNIPKKLVSQAKFYIQ